MVEDSSRRSQLDPKDSSATRSGPSRLLWNVAGTFFLSIGAVGIVVPLLPTTPFVLLAGACYLRGSTRMYNWLLSNRYFGAYMRNYMEGKGVPLNIRIATVALLWIVIGFSAFFVVDSMIIRAVLLLVALGVSIHVLMIRGK